MATANPITDLQDVQSWLGTLSVGGQASISPSMFAAQMVKLALTLLPDSDPIALTVTAIDAAGATLTGTATILGEAGTTAVFAFTEPSTDLLLCTITFTLPQSLEWTLIDSLGVSFGSLAATLTPYPDLKVVGMEFDAAITTTTTPPLNLPISLNVPTFAGDWTLSSTNAPIGALSADALNALAGGVDVLGMLPTDLADLSKLKLANFQVAFNVAEKSCSLLRLSMEYDGNWSFFNGKFIVQSVTFDVEVFKPFTKSMSYDAKLYAQMQIPPLPAFDVGGQFPDPAVFVQLAPDATLKLTDVFAFFGVTLPAGMPEVEISTLGFTLHPSDGQFQFNLAITKPIPIYKSFALDSFLFNIGATLGSSNKLTVQGGLYAAMSVGQTNPTTMSIAGAYSESGGLDLIGQAENIPLGEIIADLAAKFAIPACRIPAPIGTYLKIKSLRTEVNTGSSTFDFTCIGETTVSGTTVDFIPTIHVNYGQTDPSADFSGLLVLHVPQEGGKTKDLTFKVEFSETPTDTWIQANFYVTDGVIEFADLAAVFGAAIPPIPENLDLALTGVGFRYDFTDSSLTLGAQSKNYGAAVFASQVINKTSQYFFLLDANQTFSLSNLPLVGKDLAQIENISVTKLGVIVSTLAPVDGPTAVKINAQITAVLGSGYPQMPAAGIDGKLLLSAELDFGSEKLPLSVSLLGGSSSTAPPSAASALAATNAGNGVTASSASDSVTWFNVQKSFGPVSFQRIGVMYQSDQQVLWFELDASLAFGPMTMDLVGLGLGSPLSSFEPQFSLMGLGLSYSSPPLTIAGSLTNLAPPGADYIEFEGGVTIGTGDFTVNAFGFYGNQGGFSSMFIFGDIAYDFGGPPAFFVTGIALGFGYNSNLRIPTIDEVAAFPFVQVLPTSMVPNTGVFGANPTPQKVLDVIMNTQPAWVSPQQGTLWFAAGITFTSFELVNSQALIMVEFGQELIIALVGTSRAQFPQGLGSEVPVYAYIELDLEVEFAPLQGIFSVQAVLAKSSFLLDKACVLQGGFAFFVWYGPNPHAGDFVLTLGGYNPGYMVPSYYPKVPQVGFHWSLDSSISISGGAYFAFTPSALMVGGELNATYQAGNLKAWFDAHADIIVQWSPFWFDAAFGISIGASYKVDLWFTSFTVTAELGCNLEVWGPPTGGVVGVDWYIISFSIPFGASKNSSKPVLNQWSQVQAMLPNSGTSDAPNVITLSPAAGLTPTTTSPANSGNGGGNGNAASAAAAPAVPAPWIVRGSQFSFNTSSSIPASSASVGNTHAVTGSQFNVAPLGWSNVAATHAVTIVDSAGNDYSASFSIAPSFGNVPSQLWGAQSSSTPDSSKQLVPNQLVGLAVVVNPPEIGGSAGAVNVAVNLANINLNLPGAVIGISSAAAPEGDIAVNSPTTLAVIADPTSGIASVTATAARTAIFTALGALQYTPSPKNDPLSNFASQAGRSFAAVPLLVA